MINWKRRALELAETVNRYHKKKFHSDMKLAGDQARELIDLGKKEKKAREKYLEWWKCEDKKESVKLFDEYTVLVEKCC